VEARCLAERDVHRYPRTDLRWLLGDNRSSQARPRRTRGASWEGPQGAVGHSWNLTRRDAHAKRGGRSGGSGL